MLKKILLSSTIMASCLLASNNFNLNINGKSYPIELNKSKTLNVNGKNLNVNLEESKIQSYNGNIISFDYDKSLGLTKTILNEQISQTMLMSAMGSGFLIQEYDMLLGDKNYIFKVMKEELTKENARSIKVSDNKIISKNLNNGKTIIGIEFETYKSYNNETLVEYKMFFEESKNLNKSVLIVQMLSKENIKVFEKSQKEVNVMVNNFWKSLKLK